MNERLNISTLAVSDLAEGMPNLPEAKEPACYCETPGFLLAVRGFSAEEGLITHTGIAFEGSDDTEAQDATFWHA